MFTFYNLLPNFKAISALHQKPFGPTHIKTEAVLAQQVDKLVYHEHKKHFTTAVKANALFWAAAAITKNPIVGVSRFVLGQGNTWSSQLFPSLSQQPIANETEPELGVVNYLVGAVTVLTTVILGVTLGAAVGWLLVAVGADKSLIAKGRNIPGSLILTALHAVEMLIAQATGFLSLALVSIFFVVFAIIGGLLGIHWANKNPFTNEKELVLNPKEIICLNEALNSNTITYLYRSKTEVVFACPNMDRVIFKFCLKKVNNELVEDNFATQNLYQEMLKSVKSSLNPLARLPLTLIPVSDNNSLKQCLIAEERASEEWQQTCYQSNFKNILAVEGKTRLINAQNIDQGRVQILIKGAERKVAISTKNQKYHWQLLQGV